jgi:trigger factor
VKVTLERLPESRVQLDIEVDQDRLEQSLTAAYRRVAGRTRIPGFRPGKAPRNIVERMVGRTGLIREALDTLVPDVYNEAIAEQDVDAIGQPELEILEFEPVRFKATVPVRPTVDLGEYTGIRVQAEPVNVTKEMVDEQILLLRRRHATQAPVDRPVQWNDILIADVSATVEEEPFVTDEDAEFPLREGQTLLLPGLAEAFTGMTKGEEKTVEIDIPDDFQIERHQGKKASFTLTLKEIKEELLPAEDDDLASLVNAEEFPTFSALKQRIEDDLLKSLQTQEDNRFQQQAVDKLVEVANLEYPRILVDREIDHLVSESVGNDRENYVRYLQSVGRTEEEFRETFREAAEVRVRRSLVLSELADVENIEVTDADVDDEINKLIEPMGEDGERFRDLFAGPDSRSSIERNLYSRKTLERLQAIASADGGAPAKKAPAAKKAAAATAEEATEKKPAAKAKKAEGDAPAAKSRKKAE